MRCDMSKNEYIKAILIGIATILIGFVLERIICEIVLKFY